MSRDHSAKSSLFHQSRLNVKASFPNRNSLGQHRNRFYKENSPVHVGGIVGCLLPVKARDLLVIAGVSETSTDSA